MANRKEWDYMIVKVRTPGLISIIDSHTFWKDSM